MHSLCNTAYPVTPTQIGKAIGFAKARSLYAALDQLSLAGFVTFYESQFFDHTARYFFPTPLGREKYCQLVG